MANVAGLEQRENGEKVRWNCGQSRLIASHQYRSNNIRSREKQKQ